MPPFLIEQFFKLKKAKPIYVIQLFECKDFQ
jgi:hypothetical protein